MSVKNDKLGEHSCSDGMLSGRIHPWEEVTREVNKNGNRNGKAKKNGAPTYNNNSNQRQQASDDKDLVKHGVFKNEERMDAKPAIFINSTEIIEQFNGKSPVKDLCDVSPSMKRNSNSFLTKSCELKTALSISTKDLINSYKIRKRYCSLFKTELLDNRRKHSSILPLSRSASWSEVDMIGVNEEFLEIDDVLAGGLSNDDKDCTVKDTKDDFRSSRQGQSEVLECPPQSEVLQCPPLNVPSGKPRLSGGSVQLEIEQCECRQGSPGSDHLSLPTNHNKKRVSIMLDEELLRNGYPSLLILGNNKDFEKPLKSSLKKYNGDTDNIFDGRTGLEILSNCSDDSVLETSDSYEMVEYGLNPLEMKALKQSRRKSCLCWHPDVIFNERGDTESEDTDTQDFMARLDEYFINTEKVSFTDQMVTGFLILATCLSICFLFWYQNFGEGTLHHPH